MIINSNGEKDYGDLSAVDIIYQVSMYCEKCNVRWYGCWDNYECPECFTGDLPTCDLDEIIAKLKCNE